VSACHEHPVTAWLPEVDLVEVLPTGQERVPLLVRDRDKGAHGGILAEPWARPGPRIVTGTVANHRDGRQRSTELGRYREHPDRGRAGVL